MMRSDRMLPGPGRVAGFQVAQQDPERWRRQFDEATQRYGLPPTLLQEVARIESNFNPRAVSHAGAQGLMQIVPRWHPGVNPFDPDEAIPYAASYLRENYDRFGSWELAAAAYNAGPGAVERYNGVPPFQETQQYVQKLAQVLDLQTGEERGPRSIIPNPSRGLHEFHELLRQVGIPTTPPTVSKLDPARADLARWGIEIPDDAPVNLQLAMPTYVTDENRRWLEEHPTPLERLTGFRYLHTAAEGTPFEGRPGARDEEILQYAEAGFLDQDAHPGLAKQLLTDLKDSFNPFESGIGHRERLFRTLNVGSLALPMGFAARVPMLMKAFPAVRAATMTRRGQVAVAAGSEAVLAGSLEAIRGDTPEREMQIVQQSVLAGAFGGALGYASGWAGKAARAARSGRVLEQFQDAAKMTHSTTPLMTEQWALLTPGDPGFADAILARHVQATTEALDRVGYRSMPVRFNQQDGLLVGGLDEASAIALAKESGSMRVLTRDGMIDLEQGMRYPLDPGSFRVGIGVAAETDMHMLIDPGGLNMLLRPAFDPEAGVRLAHRGPVGPLTDRMDAMYDGVTSAFPGAAGMERLRNFDVRPILGKAYRKVVRDIYGLEQVERALMQASRGESGSVSSLFELLRTNYSTWMETAVNMGVTRGLGRSVGMDEAGQPVVEYLAPSLRSIWGKLAPEEFTEMQRFGTARRVLQIQKDHGEKALDMLPRVNGKPVMSFEEAADFISMSPPRVQEAYEATLQWQNAVLESTLLDSGILSRRQFNAITRVSDGFPDVIDERQMLLLKRDLAGGPLAKVNPTTGAMSFNEAAIARDFTLGFPYLRGLVDSPTSLQKKEVFKDIDPRKLREALGDEEGYRAFIQAHEEAHLSLGHTRVKDLMSSEAIAMERAANEAAFESVGIKMADLLDDGGGAPLRDMVPWSRVTQSLERVQDQTAIDLFPIHDPLKRIRKEGQEASFVPWTEELIRRGAQYARMGDQQRAINAMVGMMEGAVREGDEGTRALARLGLERVKGPPPTTSQIGREMDGLLDDMAGAAGRASAESKAALRTLSETLRDDGYIRSVVGGEAQWFRVTDAALWDAVKSLGPTDLGALQGIARYAGIPAATLRAGVTLGADFLAKNPLRDVFFAFVNAGTNPMAPVRGLASLMKADAMYEAWMASGGPRSALVSLDRASTKRLVQDMHQQGVQLTNVVNPNRWLHALQALSEGLENTTRLGMFKQEWMRLTRSGMDPQQAVLDAALASKHSSVNFSMQGASSLTGFFRQTSAFWNAIVQGVDQLAHSAMKDPAGFTARGSLLTLGSVALYQLNRQDEEYRRGIPDWEKNLFWHVRMPEGAPVAAGEWLRFPKPFEPGILFASLPERFLEAMDDADPELLDHYYKTTAAETAKSLLPTPQLMQVGLELWRNESAFTGAPIVPGQLQEVDADYHDAPRQSALARGLADMFNRGADLPEDKISPLQIDHLLRGFTGELGTTIYSTVPEMLYDGYRGIFQGEEADPRRNMMQGLRRLPGAGTFYSSYPYSSQTTQDAYTIANRAQVAARTAAHLEESFRIEELGEYLVEKASEIAAAPVTQMMTEEMAQFREMRTGVLQDPEMPIELKRQTIHKMTRELNQRMMHWNKLLQDAYELRPFSTR
jgi:hypothetical protein